MCLNEIQLHKAMGGVLFVLILTLFVTKCTTLYYDGCVSINKTTVYDEFNNTIASNFQVGSRYSIKLSQRVHGFNSARRQRGGGSLCEYVCKDGASAFFEYNGDDVVCALEIIEKECENCPHVCSQHLTIGGRLTSKDACYTDTSSLAKDDADTVDLLRAFWKAMISGTLTNIASSILFQDRLAQETKNCLKGYTGHMMPQQSGNCPDSIGDFCLNDYCVSRYGMGRGFTNQFVKPGQSSFIPSSVPLGVCRFTNNVDYFPPELCSECIIPVDIKTQQVLHPLPVGCKKLVASLKLTAYTNQEMLNAAVFLTTNKFGFTGLEFETEGFNAALSTFLEMLHTDISQRPGLLTLDVNVMLTSTGAVTDYRKQLTDTKAAAYPDARIVWLNVGAARETDFGSSSPAEVLLNAMVLWRSRFSTGIIDPSVKDTQNVLSSKTVHAAYSIPLRKADLIAFQHDVLGTNEYRLNDLTNGKKSYYYYVGEERLIFCPGVQMYTNNNLYLGYPYKNTSSVPFLNIYHADSDFECKQGPPVPENKCKGPLPTLAFSVLKQQEEQANPGEVYWEPDENCYWGPNGPKLCSFSEVNKQVTSTMYMINDAVVDEIQEFPTHYLGFKGFYKVIDAFGDIVEIFALDQICGGVDINKVPTCVQAVCDRDQSCIDTNAQNACYMDTAVRDSVKALIDEFEYAKTRYKDTISIAETWRKMSATRPKRFWAEIMAGAALALAGAAFGMASVALYKADVAMYKANQAFDMGLKNQIAITKVGLDVDILKTTLDIQKGELVKIKNTVVQLGNSVVRLSASMQAEIESVNGRISFLEASVNTRFTQVATYINEVVSSLGNAITLQGRAAIYFQQLNALSNTVIQSTSKLTSQTIMYSDCLQSIFNGKLYGCKIKDPFLTINPDYAVVKSVYGAVFDGSYLSVMFKIPKSVKQTALYTIAIKPIMINNSPHIVDSSNTMVGADGRFYIKPYCEGVYCMPLEEDTRFAACFAEIRANNSAGVEKLCVMIACQQAGCADKLKMKTVTGELQLSAEPLVSFTFKSPKFFQVAFDPLVIQNMTGYANITSIDDILIDIIENSNNMSIYVDNATKIVDELLNKIGGSKAVMDILFGGGSGLFPSSGLSTSTIIIIVCVVIAAAFAVALGIYCYCKQKKTKGYNRLSQFDTMPMREGSMHPTMGDPRRMW
ncbi:ORF46-like protein [Bufonid herpesvirus 1]|uniref:ORF46-like protein n=1 Tax=Bufonid herpesvirus 1 TaxID=2282206 RepID=UPI000EB61ABC|nr:ORF46-like protein [Bufonid herpesvirus 1]AXF48601.1 ORF46-like protein [Bufonid herpesvirus 1]